VAKSVTLVPGVVSADLNFASGTLLIEYEAADDPRERVVAVVERSGHGIVPVGEAREPAGAQSSRPWMARNRTSIAVVGSGAFSLAGWALTQVSPQASAGAYLLAVLMGFSLLGPRALASVRARSVDMNVLMMIAVVGAFGIGAFSEAATVVFLFALGGWLESRALARTRSSIRDLMSLAPQMARVRRGAQVVEVDPDDVSVGEVIIVRPGERIALDGVIALGFSAVDEAPITGEPIPADKSLGDPVYAGSLNTSGLLEVTVTAEAAGSTLARIVFQVEEAQAARAPVQLVVDRFSRVYTPLAVGLAVVIAVGGPLITSAVQGTPVADLAVWSEWFYRSLVVLVAACPCALVISTPVTLVSAISRAARDGVLVKGGAFLEQAARVRAVAFDKTGTLTAGRPTVRRVHAEGGLDADEILALAASLEANSTHPLARAVLAEAQRVELSQLQATEVVEQPGRGVSGTVAGKQFHLVSPIFAEELVRIPPSLATLIEEAENAGMTILVLAEDCHAPLGFLGVADAARKEAPAAIAALHRGGIEHLVMLTGDNERTAAAVAHRLGLSTHMARLLPADKVAAVQRLQERWGVVAMVGDGVNDAPALAAADIGIAMGAAGSDTALETADVALMADDLTALPGFFALGRRTLAIIRQNVAFSVAIKIVVLVAAVFGYANMWLAVFADTGVALLVIANGMRLLARSSAGSRGRLTNSEKRTREA